MSTNAWSAQSQSLVRVQQEGGDLEKLVKNILGWDGGKIVYDHHRQYKLQTDCVYPSLARPEVVVSVTYTDPDTRGHSNENKLQLKVGELALLKYAHPNIRVVLAIGGAGEAWLQYVLKVFHIFFDEVLFLWLPEHRNRLHQIGQDPQSVPIKNQQLWEDMRSEWLAVPLAADTYTPPNCLVRYEIADVLRKQNPIVHNPSLIENEIAKACMRESFNRSGTEWQSYLKENWFQIEMSRNYFNPVEAAIELSLRDSGLAYRGGIAQDIDVPSLLHDFGMTNTKVSEDFVLFSERYQTPVYIQSKSSGGGRERHGKNIQNRTKEQITRGIFYRCNLNNGAIRWQPKKFFWLSVLDGDWGVSKQQPLKYIHMLQLAGYDRLFAASDLITPDLGVKRKDNPLIECLIGELHCRKQTPQLNQAALL
jgi:hypothetical protein